MNYTFRRAFTIVELLIVIVVIAILAAITIVAYNGITAKAHTATLQADLRNAATAMEVDHTLNGSYDTVALQVNNGKGLPQSGGTIYSFHSDGTTYCITGTSSYSGVNSFYISSDTGSVQTGKCPQDAGATVTTLVGGYSGYAESPSTVLLNAPSGLTTGGGALFFLDSSSPRVRKLTTGGTTTFIAGSSTSAFADGTGSAAQFNWPQAVTTDLSGNLYIADTNNNRIREVTSAGVVTTLAGTGSTSGVTNGACTSATFNAPRGIVYYGGVLYVADSNNHLIRSITLSGCTVATFAGSSAGGGFADGTGTAAKFLVPEGLAADSAGNIYVADSSNNRIREITPAGVVTTIAGNGTAGNVDGAASSAQFSKPQAIAVTSDGSSIYISDTSNDEIRKLANGTVTTIAGNGTAGNVDGQGNASEFSAPNGLALIGTTLYVADTGNSRIRVLTNI